MSTASDTLAVAILIPSLAELARGGKTADLVSEAAGLMSDRLGSNPTGPMGRKAVIGALQPIGSVAVWAGVAPDLTLPARTSNGDWRGGGRPGMVADPRRLAADCGTRHALGNRSAGGTS